MKEIISKFRTNQKGTINYIVNVPSKFVPKMPMILYLHDLSERGANVYDIKKYGIHQYINNLEISYIVLSPQCGESNFWDYHLYDIELLIDEIQELYNSDTSRICIIGIGLGAYGAWNYIMQRPEKFRGIISIAGGIMMKNYIDNIKHIASFIIHSEDDKVISVNESKEAYTLLEELGADTTLKIIKGKGSKAYNKIFEDKKIYEWLETRI